MEMDFPGSAGDSGAAAVYRLRRRNSAATVELAAAAALWLAADYFLESTRNSGALPDLFGGFGGHGSHRSNFRRRMRDRMAERWEHMTPEERERARQGMGGRCGFAPP